MLYVISLVLVYFPSLLAMEKPAQVVNPTHALFRAAADGDLATVTEIIANPLQVQVMDLDKRTALFYAASRGRLAMVRKLCSAGLQINQSDAYATTPIYWAAKNGHIHVVNELLCAGAQVNVTHTATAIINIRCAEYKKFNCTYGNMPMSLYGPGDHHSLMTPLHWAANNGHTEIVKKLLMAQAVLNAKNNEGYAPLELAAKNGHSETVNVLLSAGAKFDLDRAKELLYDAIRKNYTSIATLLISSGVPVNDPCNHTTLLLAATKDKKNPTVVQALLLAGAQVDVSDEDGNTPLHYAVEQGDLISVQALLKAGAPINVKNRIGRMPYFFAYSSDIKQILICAGAAVNLNPLHRAVICGNIDHLKELLAAGQNKESAQACDFNIDVQSEDGRTALHYAAEYGFSKMVKPLLNANASTDVKDRLDETPLHKAVKGRALKIMRLLCTAHEKANASLQEIGNPVRVVQPAVFTNALQDFARAEKLMQNESQADKEVARALFKKAADQKVNAHISARASYCYAKNSENIEEKIYYFARAAWGVNKVLRIRALMKLMEAMHLSTLTHRILKICPFPLMHERNMSSQLENLSEDTIKQFVKCYEDVINQGLHRKMQSRGCLVYALFLFLDNDDLSNDKASSIQNLLHTAEQSWDRYIESAARLCRLVSQPLYSFEDHKWVGNFEDHEWVGKKFIALGWPAETDSGHFLGAFSLFCYGYRSFCVWGEGSGQCSTYMRLCNDRKFTFKNDTDSYIASLLFAYVIRTLWRRGLATKLQAGYGKNEYGRKQNITLVAFSLVRFTIQLAKAVKQDELKRVLFSLAKQILTYLLERESTSWVQSEEDDYLSVRLHEITPDILFIAAQEGFNDIIRLIITKKIYLNYQNSDGRTALHLAAKSGHVETVQLLIEGGANTSLSDGNGSKALKENRAGRRAFHYSLKRMSSNRQLMQVFLDAGEKINMTQEEDGIRKSFFAAELENDLESIEMLLAAEARHISVAKIEELIPIILSLGTDFFKEQIHNEKIPEAIAKVKSMPFEEVAKLISQIEAIMALLIDEIIKNKKKIDAFILFDMIFRHKKDHDYDEFISALLTAETAVKIKNSVGWTFLHCAVLKGLPKTITKLLSLKVPVNEANQVGRRPLHYAVLVGDDEELVQQLIEGGASPNLQDTKGLTPLHLACLKGHSKSIKVLLAAGASINIKDIQGNTPLHYALTKGNDLSAAECLLEQNIDAAALDSKKNNLVQLVLSLGSSERQINLLKALLKKGVRLEPVKKLILGKAPTDLSLAERIILFQMLGVALFKK